MATKLDKTLKRELDVNGEPYMLTISPEGLKVVPKAKRNGIELAWKDLVSGQAALAAALNASLEQTRSCRQRRLSPASRDMLLDAAYAAVLVDVVGPPTSSWATHWG